MQRNKNPNWLDKRIAYHEAGHAVAYFLCDVGFRWVEILDHSRPRYLKLPPDIATELKRVGYELKKGDRIMGLGRIKPSRIKQRFTKDDDILITLSGPVCVNIRYRENELITYSDSRHEISAINLAYGNVDHHWKWVKATMKQPEVWGAVEAVARELVVRRRIPCAEVEKIITESLSS